MDALTLYRLALKADAAYDEARFRLSQMYYDCGEPEHARIEFARLAHTSRADDLAAVAQYYAALIARDYGGLLELAADEFASLAEQHKGTVFAPMAALEAARLYEQTGKPRAAYDAYVLTDVRVTEAAETAGWHVRQWAGFPTYELRRFAYEARTRYAAYMVKWLLAGALPPLPSWAVTLSPANPTFKGSGLMLGGAVSEFGGRKRNPAQMQIEEWLFLPEEGLAISALEFSCTAHPVPFQEEKRRHSQNRFIMLLTSDMSDPLLHWTANATIPVQSAGVSSRHLALPRPCYGVKLFIRQNPEVLMEEFSVSASFVGATESTGNEALARIESYLKTAPAKCPVREVSACRSRNGALHVFITDRHRCRISEDDPTSVFNGDIWLASGIDALGPPHKLTMNSIRNDYHPSVAQDREGTYWMVFCSQRGVEEHAKLWMATSKDLRQWTMPRLLELDVNWAYHREGRPDEPAIPIYPNSPRLLIGRDGRFWLAFMHGSDLLITNSEDGAHWRKPVTLGPTSFPRSETTVATCEGEKGNVVVAFQGRYWYTMPNGKSSNDEGILIASVAPDLSFKERKVGNGAYTQPAYGWKAPECRPVDVFRLDDGRFLLLLTRNNKGLCAAISADLVTWKCARIDPTVYYGGPGACAMTQDALLVVRRDESTGIYVKPFPLREMLAVIDAQEAVTAPGAEPLRTPQERTQ